MADIVLKDRNGKDITYPGIYCVELKTTDGGTQTFAACEDIEKTVSPDFSEGDVEVLPDEGTLLAKVTIEKPETLLPENIRSGTEVAGVTGEFIGDTEEVTVELALADGNQEVVPSADGKVISSVTITKPGTLVPENIAEGVDIAGIVGTLVAGGGSSGIVSHYATFTGGSDHTSQVITHNLGVIPDLVFMYSKAITNGYPSVCVGMSTAAKNAGIQFPLNLLVFRTSAGMSYRTYTTGIDGTATGLPINNANDTKVTISAINSTNGFFMPNIYHYVYIIGGLT